MDVQNYRHHSKGPDKLHLVSTAEGHYGTQRYMYNLFQFTDCAPYRPQFRMHWTQPLNALKFSGTLLPLPARYLRSPPTNGRGLGSSPSPWNLNRGSSIRTKPCDGEICALGEGDEPPLVNVYALESSAG